MNMNRNISIKRYIRLLIEFIKAFTIAVMSFIALKSLVILNTLKVLKILMDLNAEIALPPVEKTSSTIERRTTEPSK